MFGRGGPGIGALGLVGMSEGRLTREMALKFDRWNFANVMTVPCGNGQIMVVATPAATKAEWDRAWDRLPDIEVEEFDYFIRPNGTEVYMITPGLTVSGNR